MIGEQSVVFIGDVHGWLDRLLTVVNGSAKPLVLVGDLIDRGPDSAGVIKQVRAWTEKGRARCVLGNHEYALVRGLGVPELGIEADLNLLAQWYHGYGGQACVTSYGIDRLADDRDVSAFRSALGSDLTWLAQLPWLLEDPHWVVNHAGFAVDRTWSEQLIELRNPHQWWQGPVELPDCLYAKDRIGCRPTGCPSELWLVCGHVPQKAIRISQRTAACDTSGGHPHRKLSALHWPEGRVSTAV